MSCIRHRLTTISLVLFVAFVGQMAVHAAEQAGWICCGASTECRQDNAESPVDPHTTHGGCCQHVLLVSAGLVGMASPVFSQIQYPPFSNLRPDGPVFEIEIPPQQS